MGIGSSLALMTIGAILAFAVTAEVDMIDLQTAGVILLLAGLIGLVLSVVYWDRWWGGWTPSSKRRKPPRSDRH